MFGAWVELSVLQVSLLVQVFLKLQIQGKLLIISNVFWFFFNIMFTDILEKK